VDVWRGGCAGGPYGPGTGYDPGDIYIWVFAHWVCQNLWGNTLRIDFLQLTSMYFMWGRCWEYVSKDQGRTNAIWSHFILSSPNNIIACGSYSQSKISLVIPLNYAKTLQDISLDFLFLDSFSSAGFTFRYHPTTSEFGSGARRRWRSLSYYYGKAARSLKVNYTQPAGELYSHSRLRSERRIIYIDSLKFLLSGVDLVLFDITTFIPVYSLVVWYTSVTPK